MSTTQGQSGAVNITKESSSKCEECGNQAKKDCAYKRCRTCCKNKGFVCQTHIRSTWIPVHRRRHQLEELPSPSPNKRHKHNNPSSSRLEEMKFPATMNSMAVFSCVRVRSMDETVNEIAYQTSVKIGGHVFSGLVYDQGPADQELLPQQQSTFNFNTNTNNNATSIVVYPLDQQINLTLFNPSDGSATVAPPNNDLFYPSSSQHPLGNSFRPGMPYFPLPKP